MTAPIASTDPAWRALKLWLSVEIRKDQKQLEASGLSAQQYDVHRGRIAARRDLLVLVEPARLIEADKVQEEDFYGGD